MSDWLFLTNQSVEMKTKVKREITFDTQMKTAEINTIAGERVDAKLCGEHIRSGMSTGMLITDKAGKSQRLPTFCDPAN